jgi:hypothetical protein
LFLLHVLIRNSVNIKIHFLDSLILVFLATKTVEGSNICKISSKHKIFFNQGQWDVNTKLQDTKSFFYSCKVSAKKIIKARGIITGGRLAEEIGKTTPQGQNSSSKIAKIVKKSRFFPQLLGTLWITRLFFS